MQLELSPQEWAALMSAVAEHESQLTYFIEKYSECALELKVLENVKDKLIKCKS